MNKSVWLSLWVVCICLAWLQPDHFPPWLSFHSEVLAFAAVAVCSFSVIQRGDRADSNKFAVGMPELVLGAVILIVLIQYAAGAVIFGGDVVVLVLYLLGLSFAIYTGRLMGGGRSLEMFSWSVLIAGLCSIAIALFQSTRSYDELALVNLMPGWRRPGANLGQANHFGTLVLWSVGSAVYLCIRKKISLILASTLVVLMLFGASMSESRTALIGVWVLAIWLIAVPYASTLRWRIAVATLFVLSGTVFFMSWPGLLDGVHEGGWASSEARTATINTQGGARFVVWPQLLGAVGMRPLAGWGFGGVSHALNAVADQYSESFPFTYAHNVLLDLLVWFGVPLSITLCGLACVWLWTRAAAIRHANDWYAVALLIPFGIHSLLEFPFAYAYFLFPAGYLIGVLDSGREKFRGMTVTRGMARSVLLVWIVIAGKVAHEYMLAEEDYRVARAEALRVGRTPLEYRRPQLQLLTQLDALNKSIRVVPTPKMKTIELEMLRMAAMRFPSIAIQNRYAMALALNGDLAEARRQLKVIRSMHGARTYEAVSAQWSEFARDKFPQLGYALIP